MKNRLKHGWNHEFRRHTGLQKISSFCNSSAKRLTFVTLGSLPQNLYHILTALSLKMMDILSKRCPQCNAIFEGKPLGEKGPKFTTKFRLCYWSASSAFTFCLNSIFSQISEKRAFFLLAEKKNFAFSLKKVTFFRPLICCLKKVICVSDCFFSVVFIFLTPGFSYITASFIVEIAL